jgi:hypothetical protein
LINELSNDISSKTIDEISLALVAIKMAHIYAGFLSYYKQDISEELSSLVSRARRLRHLLVRYKDLHPDLQQEVFVRVALLDKVILGSSRES